VEALRSRDLALAEQTLRNHFKRGEAAVLDL
jgi:DNA-binding GntR family transcriptional regulator